MHRLFITTRFWALHVQYLHLHAVFHLLSAIAPYNLLVFLTFHRLRVMRREARHKVDVGCVVYVHVVDLDAKDS